MAIKYAIKTGNFSDPTLWNDGIIPSEGDSIYCNGYVITANEADLNNISYERISNYPLQEENINPGGRITINNTYTAIGIINSDIYSYNDYALDCNEGKHTINGNIYSYSMLASIKFTGRYSVASGAAFAELTINGNIQGGIARDMVSDNGSLTITINGNWDASVMFIQPIRTNMWCAGGTFVTVNGKLTSTNPTNGGSTWLEIKCNELELTNDFFPPNMVYGTHTNILECATIIYNTYRLYGWEFRYANTMNIYDRDGRLVMLGSAYLPKTYEVKKGVVYSNLVGTYESTTLTDEQLQRIANCATMDEVAQLSIVIANKEIKE